MISVTFHTTVLTGKTTQQKHDLDLRNKNCFHLYFFFLIFQTKQVKYSFWEGGCIFSLNSLHICQTVLRLKCFPFESVLVLTLTAAIINHERATRGQTDPLERKKNKSDKGVDGATKTKRFGDLQRGG